MLRGLYIIPSDYAALSTKGVADLMKGQEEQGFFERLVTVHPWATQTRVLDLSPIHRLYEFHETIPSGLGRFKLFRYPYHLAHYLRLIKIIIRIIDNEKLSMIRATDPFFTGSLAWMVTRFRPLPTCISIHADYDKRFELDGSREAPTLLGSRRAARWIENFILRRADLVMPIRQTLADKVRRYGVPENRIRVIPHGLYLDPFSHTTDENIRSALDLQPGTRILSFTGRLTKDNYVQDYIELAEVLHRRRSDFVLVMAGDGSERAALAEQINRRGLSDIVKLIGYRSQAFVVELRKQSAVSLSLMGGYSLIEACAAASPVVAYDVEWHSELVQTGVTGLLIRERDIAALVEGVDHLLAHPEEARRMGEAAKALAFERHDIQKTSLIKRACYDELVKIRPR